MHLAHIVIAGTVLLEFHAEPIEILDHREAALRIGHHGRLMNDAVIGYGDFLHILLGCRMAGDDSIVEPVHAHADGAAALHIGLFHQHDA